jgi:hypothetical protein
MVKTKEGGFYASLWRPERRQLPLWLWFLALAALLWTAGATRALSQSSGLSSSSSSGDMRKWDELSTKFNRGLDEQSVRLQQALTEMETSKASSRKLTLLLEQSLTANESLKNYNAQIALRMQERDEDLVWAYGRIETLERQRRVMIICIAVMAAVFFAIAIVMAKLKL